MKLSKKGFSRELLSHPLFVTTVAIFCCLLWGSATPCIKLGYELVLPERNVPSTILFAGIRFFFAGILTVIIFSAARRKLLFPKPKSWGMVLTVSAFQTVLQYIFFYVGLANTSGVKGTILTGSSTFFAILVSSLIFRIEKLNVKKIVACVLGLAGIVIINLNGLDLHMNFLGDGFAIFSAISLAISSTLIKIFSSKEDPVTISGYQFIIGGAVMIVIGLAFGGKIYLGEPLGVVILIYLSFLSAIAYSLWGILLKHNPVSSVTVFSFTTPVFGVLLTMLMLREDSNVSAINLILALLLVCGGIFLLNFKPRAAEKAAAKEKGVAGDDGIAENDN
jgi:drug/metabolite transporter (DMT)-like permease